MTDITRLIAILFLFGIFTLIVFWLGIKEGIKIARKEVAPSKSSIHKLIVTHNLSRLGVKVNGRKPNRRINGRR